MIEPTTRLFEEVRPSAHGLRSTEQFLMPATKVAANIKGYQIYPAFHIEGAINTGFESIASWILAQKANVTIDGYIGVYWEHFVTRLNNCLLEMGVSAKWLHIDLALKSPEDIALLTKPYLNDPDPLFGKIYLGEISDFFDAGKLLGAIPYTGSLSIVYGCGASLAAWEGATLYVDVPKNEIQFRSRAGNTFNLGIRSHEEQHAATALDPKLQYKRFYFIDWPVLNGHKRKVLPDVDVFIDEQRITDISWISGNTLRKALAQLSRNAFRVRPWFEPGVWGGQWIKDHIMGMNKLMPNYAWSFELISPENGIILENNETLLEVSFDLLLYQEHHSVLGKAAGRFGVHFPIRFDLLDTIEGSNLSLQCHPTVAYTQEHFGEDFTQDETYYILETKPGAIVYLGFQENIDKSGFKAKLTESFELNLPVSVESYVQTFPARKHDLFLIPNGTVHCSGRDNLVLEISATPYIYTFKMYDWLRADLSGNPRTLNVERAFANLDFSRKGSVVSKTLISKQTVSETGPDYTVTNLSTHPDHFYAVERIEFSTQVVQATNGQCHILSLVEGESILVETHGQQMEIHSIETFVIPASALTYTLLNTSHEPAKVIRAFVKNEAC